MGEEELLFSELPAVTIASDKAQTVEEAPANVYVITGEEMMARGYRSVFDLLDDLPGMTYNHQVGNDSNGQPVIRGIQGKTKLKVMLNGMGLNSKATGLYIWSESIPVEGVDRVEFILGPYASLYGRNSFTGVINIITKSGQKINGGIADATAGLWGRQQGSLIIGKKAGKTDVYFSALHNSSRKGIDMVKEYPELYDPANREGRRNPSGGAIVSLAGMPTEWPLFWDYSDFYATVKHETGFSADFNYNRTIWPGAGTFLNPYGYVQPQDSQAIFEFYNYRAAYDYQFGSAKLSSIASFQTRSGSDKLDYINDTTKYFVHKNFSKQAEQKLHCPLAESNSLYAVVSYDVSDDYPVTQGARAKSATPYVFSTKDRLRYAFLTASLQDEWKLGERLTVVPGAMYQHANLAKDIVLPRFSLMFEPTDRFAVKLLYGGGFVTPDSYYRANQTTIKGASNLKPEKVTSYEFNALYRLADATRVNGSLFINQGTDIIMGVPIVDPVYITSWANLGKMQSRGGELNLNSRLGETVNIFVSAGYVEGFTEIVSGGSKTKLRRLPMASRTNGKAGVNVLLLEKNLNLYVHDLLIGRMWEWPTVPKPNLGGYNLVDVNLMTTKKFSASYWFSAGVRNVLDRKAFNARTEDAASNWQGPINRRNWTATAGIRF